MTVLHSGSTKKYAANWENIFAGKATRKKPAPTARKPAARKPAAKKGKK